NGLGVFLDVVYNHLGPEGNYLWDYAPYFTHKYQSPWGASLNFDGRYSDHVRDYFIQNAIYWMRDYHIDGFRLDATHALFDFSARPFLTELTANIQDWAESQNKRVYVIAESDKSDRTLHLPREANGVGLDGQWLDDLHHVLHCTLTGENDGYYADYADFSLLYKILREGFAYTGQFAPAWNRRHGTPSADIPTHHFIVASQNHDQVGNRMLGERLSALTDFDGLKIAAALALLSPYVPMLFMGEEYGETAPFLYFVSHGDTNLIEGVRKGRAEEFSAFKWKGTPPDPQADSTFLASKLKHDLYQKGKHAILYRLYGYLLGLRREHPVLTNPHRDSITIYGDTHTESRMVCIERHDNTQAFRIILNFHPTQAQPLAIPTSGVWHKICDSNAPEWCVDGQSGVVAPDTYQSETAYPPKSFVIYHQVRA
ncbi:MAG: DUF3459 domain-containing protein, partial [Anaerolineae bacterium]|nr:DUF3459 domain-containing protein [Anaerolineae bacterium]